MQIRLFPLRASVVRGQNKVGDVQIFVAFSKFPNYKSPIYLVCHNRKPKRRLIGNEIILKVWIVFQGSVVDCDKGL